MTTQPDTDKPQSISVEMLNAYGLMLTCLFLTTLLLVAVLSVPLFIGYFLDWRLPVLPFVALCGALGAFMSSLSRLYGLKNLPALLLNQDFRLMKNGYVVMYSLIPPLVGIIAAVATYVAIAAGFLQGDLFQRFHCFAADGNCDTGIDGLLKYGPMSAADCAKSLIWAFVAGFSERFFPGVIEGLAKQK